jgi:hypothetical protein
VSLELDQRFEAIDSETLGALVDEPGDGQSQ